MKYRIDKYGNLHKWVGGKWKETICKFKQTPCGDHCPDFGEVATMTAVHETGDVIDTGERVVKLAKQFSLVLCDNNILNASDLTDERERC